MVRKGLAGRVPFQMVNAVDFTPLAGLTPATSISKDGGAFVTTTNTAVEIGIGWYYVELTDDEADADEIVLVGTDTGAAQSGGGISTTTYTTGGGGGSGAIMYNMWKSGMDEESKIIKAFIKNYEGQLEKSAQDRELIAKIYSKIDEMNKDHTSKVNELHKALKSLTKTVDQLTFLAMKNATTDQLEALTDGL